MRDINILGLNSSMVRVLLGAPYHVGLSLSWYLTFYHLLQTYNVSHYLMGLSCTSCLFTFSVLFPWHCQGVIKHITKPFELYWISSRPVQKWSPHKTQGSIPYSFNFDKTWSVVNRKYTLKYKPFGPWSNFISRE